MSIWISHPRSQQPDTMLTLSVYSVGIVLLKFLFSQVSVGPLVMGQIDAGVIASILTPILGAYSVRKMTDSPDKVNNEEKDETNVTQN